MNRRIAKGPELLLGRQGEHLATQIRFPAQSYLDTYGEGVFHLIAQRQGDAVPYPVGVTRDGTDVCWNVSRTDTAAAGAGTCELLFYTGDTLAKSQIWATRVLPSMDQETPEPPDPYESWISTMLEAGAVVVEAQEAAEALAAEAGQHAQNAAESAAEAHAATAGIHEDRAAAEKASGDAEKAAGEAAAAKDSAALSALKAEEHAAAAEAARAGAEAAAATAAAADSAAKEAQASAEGAALDALTDRQAAQTAKAAAEAARDRAENGAAQAALSAAAAGTSAASALSAADTAAAQAVLAQSWTEGGTGARTGEDGNNAKYWCSLAREIVGGDYITPEKLAAALRSHDADGASHADIRAAIAAVECEYVDADTIREIVNGAYVPGGHDGDTAEEADVQEIIDDMYLVPAPPVDDDGDNETASREDLQEILDNLYPA